MSDFASILNDGADLLASKMPGTSFSNAMDGWPGIAADALREAWSDAVEQSEVNLNRAWNDREDYLREAETAITALVVDASDIARETESVFPVPPARTAKLD